MRDVDGRPLPLLVSTVIPEAFAHGFTTRAGGVSPPPYDSLNFGRSWGDGAEAVRENRRRLRVAAGARELYFATQVHGAKVTLVAPDASAEEVASRQADGLCTRAPGAALAVFVADCVPLLIADPRTGACAAVHAGWRGVVGGIPAAACARMAAELGSAPRDLRIAIGPSIGACCFEVGAEVAEAFGGAVPGAERAGVLLPRAGAKPHVDLRRAIRVALEGLGVPAASIEASDACTRCDPEGRFYSFRRDASRTGQQVGFILRR